jgi:hypothetical protein
MKIGAYEVRAREGQWAVFALGPDVLEPVSVHDTKAAAVSAAMRYCQTDGRRKPLLLRDMFTAAGAVRRAVR